MTNKAEGQRGWKRGRTLREHRVSELNWERHVYNACYKLALKQGRGTGSKDWKERFERILGRPIT